MATNEELLAAARSVVDAIQFDRTLSPSTCEVLAREYLAQHDPTPITEEWLEHSGYTKKIIHMNGCLIASSFSLSIGSL